MHREEPDDVENLEGLLDDKEEQDEDVEDEQEEVDYPTTQDFQEIVDEDVIEIVDRIEMDLKPALEGMQTLLSNINPALGERTKEWVDRMDTLCARLEEMNEAVKQLQDEATQMEAEGSLADDEDDDFVLGLG